MTNETGRRVDDQQAKRWPSLPRLRRSLSATIVLLRALVLRLCRTMQPRRAMRTRRAMRPRPSSLVWMGPTMALSVGLVMPAETLAQAKPFIVLASTTSTDQTGLFRHLFAQFERTAGFDIRVVAVGTGQALDIGRRGDADLVLVHDRALEDQFIADGWGIDRRDIMYNDFVVIGPAADPAGVASQRSAAEALRRVAQARSVFVSRGDRSGTHAAELRLWATAGVGQPARSQAWYRDIGAGMGQALNAASAMNAYTLADRGSWIAFRNRGDLRLLLEGDPSLRNPYGAMLVNPARHPHVKEALARQLLDWLSAEPGQRAIAEFRVAGEPLFFPHSGKGL